MEYQIITVVFTKRRLSPMELKGQKRYRFVCDKPVKIGDMLDSPVCSTLCQVVDIRHSDIIPTVDGYTLKTITVDAINGKPTNNFNYKTEMKQEQHQSDNMFDQMLDSFMSMCMPKQEPEVRMSMSIPSVLCVPQGDQYVGINANNQLISYPSSLTCEGLPVISIERPVSQVRPGDIIKRGRSYAKVLENSAEGLKVLSFGGTTSKQAAITNAILGQATFRVLISAFDLTGNGGGGMHPLALLAMTKMQGPEGSGDGFNGMMKMMAMGQMLQGGGGMFGNMFQQPTGQPVVQQPIDQQSAVPGTLAGMFPGFMSPAAPQPAVQQTPVQQPVEPQPAVPQPMNTAEMIEALLKDPETRNKLKEALKD